MGNNIKMKFKYVEVV